MNKGFSATELVVVIVILGLLATMSVSRFNAYLAKGRQAEATVNLTMIGTLQETWKFGRGAYNPAPGGSGVGEFGTNDRCSDNTDREQMKNELGFRPKDCEKLRYGYDWDASEATADSSDADSDKYIYPGCDEIDQWKLDYSKIEPENTTKVIEKCND